MKNIRIDYKYDGSDFYGMQRQPKLRTVQGEIEKRLQIILKEDITMQNSGRTDRGVHALFQTSNFFTNSKIPTERFFYALKNSMPDDIQLIKLCEVNDEFHSRFSAYNRAYIYKISNKIDIFKRKYFMLTDKNIEIDRLNKILSFFIGKNDFDSFRKSDCAANNSVREIYEVKAYKNEDDDIEIYIKANAFLKSMVRIIVGSALALCLNEVEEDYIINKLNNPNKFDHKILAPAEGLYLCEVNYE